MIPAEIAAPTLSLNPLEVILVTTPFLIWSINGAWTFAMELGAIEIFLIPRPAISSKTIFMT